MAPDGVQGPLCSVLLASEFLADDELCLIPGNQLLLGETAELLQALRNADGDASVLAFESLHARWPHVALDEEGNVVEAAECKLLSSTALADVYYVRNGSAWLQAAQQVIRKENRAGGPFVWSSTINELLLAGQRIS